ncbi:response regulator [Sapientia aquatica]|uniref:Response regulator n=1 Tax=Sapientia aquatica TaxID=1549640 RepID=A0A4R5W0R6_9BURK|nr:response regulator transcription factor [Sapientia aquatica]TDK65631.1 response regulator [Sapientia aquatica]
MNVCIVEDSVHIQERLKNMIEQFPEIHVSSIAGDLATATRLILKNNEYVEDTEEVQAVILDTQLPDGNSLGLLKTIKASIPTIKVVVFSNHADEECRKLAMRAGADSFLDKSTDSDQLIPLLQLWLHN